MKTKDSRAKKIVRWMLEFLRNYWILLMIVSLSSRAIEDTTWLKAYANIDWGLLVVEIGLIAFIGLVTTKTHHKNPRLWGIGIGRLFTYLRKKYFDNGAEPSNQSQNMIEENDGRNFTLLGTDIKYVGIVVCLVLMTSLPRLANLEEIIFRSGTINWGDGIIRSLLFGLVHMLVGTPLIMSLGVGIAGLFFTQMYFMGGVDLSTQAHFQYNLILFSIVLYLAIEKSLEKPAPKVILPEDEAHSSV